MIKHRIVNRWIYQGEFKLQDATADEAKNEFWNNSEDDPMTAAMRAAKYLDAMAAEGWELVSFVTIGTGTTYIFRKNIKVRKKEG